MSNDTQREKMRQQDHDLIVRLDVKLDNLASDIKDLKDGMSSRVADLESRTKKLEDKLIGYEGKGTGIKMSWLVIAGLITFLASSIALVLNAIRLFNLGS